ncbi:MAG: putative oxidoreductase [Glaciecola sp.]|jgi:putative oxidoreductase
MLVAIFVVHAADPIGTKEKALFYAVSFLAIAIAGAGKYSIDKN